MSNHTTLMLCLGEEFQGGVLLKNYNVEFQMINFLYNFEIRIYELYQRYYSHITLHHTLHTTNTSTLPLPPPPPTPSPLLSPPSIVTDTTIIVSATTTNPYDHHHQVIGTLTSL